MSTYPTLRIGVLQALLELQGRLNHDPHLLRSKECPYDKDTIAALEKLFTEKIVEKIVERVVEKGSGGGRGRPRKDHRLSVEDEALVETNAVELLQELKKMGEGAGEKGLDKQTQLAIIKAKATLIEQVIKLRERWLNVKRVAEFQSIVIGILDDLIMESDRDEFLNRIDGYRE